MSPETRHNTHVNSLLVYFEGKEEFFGKRELQVLGVIRRLGRASDREVMLALGYTDMNSVRPRINTLRDEGLLVEVADQEDPVTHKQVRVLSLGRDPRKPQAAFNFFVEQSA